VTDKKTTVGGFMFSAAVILLVALNFEAVAAPASSNTTTAPCSAEPAWDQKLDPAKRFLVLADWFNEAVLDKETGLVWEKTTASDQRHWTDGIGLDGARRYCIARGVGGRKGWRLPSIAELTSLLEATPTNPSLPQGHPFSIQPTGSYWSATTSAENSTDAWVVNLSTGHPSTSDKAIGSYQAWCVRGGMNAEAY